METSSAVLAGNYLLAPPAILLLPLFSAPSSPTIPLLLPLSSSKSSFLWLLTQRFFPPPFADVPHCLILPAPKRAEAFLMVNCSVFGSIELNPSSGVLNVGQGLFEGLKAYRKQDGNILLFRPEENALRMRSGAERMCMPSPTVEQFVEAVKATVLANNVGYVPPPGKGSLYIRPLLIGSGDVLGVELSPAYTFLIFVSPVGNYLRCKTIGNYAAVLKAHTAAKAKGYSDVLYLDSVHKKYLEEVSSCNIFVVKDGVISTPAIKGTILPGITRKSIIDIARSQGFQVEERFVDVDELLEADEVFVQEQQWLCHPWAALLILINGCLMERVVLVRCHRSSILCLPDYRWVL
ncbi:hypothetical protein M0R45_004756 [Rubus argutus]|uniref:Branched-chain-amino-acid aminotransferase n=1 Tax=Rubus argutus TaxID=59490 RepID=A0AAW1YKS2_RUBAR